MKITRTIAIDAPVNPERRLTRIGSWLKKNRVTFGQKTVALCIFIILVSSQQAYMTQTHFGNITAEEMVQSSLIILVVQKLDPFEDYERISILPEGSAYAGRNHPASLSPPRISKQMVVY